MKYMMWLIRFIDPVNDITMPFRSLEYMTLLEYLFKTEFIPFASDEYLDDYNRVQDGINLRTMYSRENPDAIFGDFLEKPCSILEMLISLSLKIEDIMYNAEIGNRTSKWFWSMLNSWLIPIEEFSDSKWTACTKDSFDIHVNRLYCHDYSINGEGGLFCIPPDRICGFTPDMRYLPIWYQMQEYIKCIPY